jgi:probable F420-dependent oxidoreductase
MRVGYVTPNSWGLDSPRQVIDLAVFAEERGAASLWVSHHVLHVGFVGERLQGRRPYYDPLAMLAAFATATSTARVGTSVLVVPYLHPIPLAKTLATIDHLSQGRLDVGVGVGGLRPEHDAVGAVAFERRGRYADEALAVVQELWAPGPSSFHGEFFGFEAVEAYPGAYRDDIPLYVGGHGAAAARRAVRFGTGWQGVGVEAAQLREVRSTLDAAFDAAGRAAEGFPLQVRLHVAVEDVDVDGWRRRADAYAAAGLADLLLAPQSGDADAHRRWLDAVLPAFAT